MSTGRNREPRIGRLEEQNDRQAQDLSVAIVHEWMTNLAGSEKCVLAMQEAFPRHRLYTSVVNGEVFPNASLTARASALQRLAFARRSHARALPLIPPAMRMLRLESDHDLVIRSFHSFATLPRSSVPTPELIYCYTPPRFLYRRGTMAAEHPGLRLAMAIGRPLLAGGDRRRVCRATAVLAISSAVADRIKQTYGVCAEVIHPPVEVDRFAGRLGPREDFFIYCSRLVPYKRPDIAVEAFRGLPHRLVVVGDGRSRARLEARAPSNVTFTGHLPDPERDDLLSRARGFVFPGEEDFGIAPVEALAAGCPVVALGRGGALDYVAHERNGLLVESQSPEAFAAAITRTTEREWDHNEIQESAQRFSSDRFITRLRAAAISVVREAQFRR